VAPLFCLILICNKCKSCKKYPKNHYMRLTGLIGSSRSREIRYIWNVGFFLPMLTLAAVSAARGDSSVQVYKVPMSGQVAFTLTEQWWEEKGLVVGANYNGDAFVTIQYNDESQQVIVFLGSSDSLQPDIHYTGNSGSSTWSETIALKPGATFTIVSSQAAWAVDRFSSVGGNSGGGAFIRGAVRKISTDARPYIPPVSQPPHDHPGSGSFSTEIHAIIISGRSDPARIVTSPNVTLTGGVVALGKNPSPPSTPTNQWSTGLRIVPDQDLLTGAKIPPLTPNIIDVRIVKHEVSGDLSTPAP
jgi:hypothetical protein